MSDKSKVTAIGHGGKRSNSGRKKGSSAFKEKTRPIRVPESVIPSIQKMLEELKLYRASSELESITLAPQEAEGFRIPLVGSNVVAGFPSPADDFIEEYLNLNELLVQRVESTYFVRVAGRSMVDANIFPEDILIVDRAVEPCHGKVVIAILENELTVKRLDLKGEHPVLKAESDEHPDIPVNGELQIWGVVTSVIHQL